MKDILIHIGRDVALNEIIINDTTVSSTHAQLAFQNNNLILIPLPSSNGIMVNEIKITNPVKLEIGDVITFGSFTFDYNKILNILKIYNYKIESIPNFKIDLATGSSLSIKKSNLQNKGVVSSLEVTNKFNLKKIIFYTLLLILVVVISFGIKLLINQYYFEEEKPKENTEISDIEKNNENNSSENSIEKKENNEKKKEPRKQRNNISYDFSCLSSSNDRGSNDMITLFGDITREIQGDFLSNINVTVKEEMEYGDQSLEDMKKEYNFLDSGNEIKKLKKILNILESKLAKPRGFKYKIHYIDNDIENVFTIGGRIFFFKGMYEKCRNDSELAAIISHEIGHNELGHLNHKIKKIKASEGFGVFGVIALGIESEITKAFNQKQETHADMFGMDLMYPTSYKNCSAIDFWDMMSESEDENNINNIFRSHPYSSNRANCVRNHLLTNYDKSCE